MLHFMESWRRLRHMGGDQCLRVGGGKERLPGQRLERQDPEPIEIRPMVQVAIAGGLLRGHVRRGAEDDSRCGSAPRQGGGAGSGDAEVGHQGEATLEQDVLGLDVAMDDSGLVGMLQRLGDLTQQSHRLGDRQRSSRCESITERSLGEVWHGVVEPAGRLA